MAACMTLNGPTYLVAAGAASLVMLQPAEPNSTAINDETARNAFMVILLRGATAPRLVHWSDKNEPYLRRPPCCGPPSPGGGKPWQPRLGHGARRYGVVP